MDSWRSALDTFIAEWGNNELISGILVAGSTVAGTANQNSDLDVHIILKRGIKWRERGDRIREGRHIEYFANPVERLEAYMLQDEVYKRITARMFAMGKIIRDDQGDVQALKNLAEKVLLEKLPPMHGSEQFFIRHVLWMQLDDMMVLFRKNDIALPISYYVALNKLLVTYAQFLQTELPDLTKLSRYFTETEWSKVYKMSSFPDQKFVEIFLKALEKVDAAYIELLTKYVLEKLGGFEIGEFIERGDLA